LDNAATTRSFDSAAAAVLQAMTEGFANPSALYASALETEKKLAEAERLVAELMGSPGYGVIFTSGGTESNNLALWGSLPEGRAARCVTTGMEHPSVSQVFDEMERRGHTVTRLGVRGGRVDLDELADAMSQGCDILSVMHVNNETGAVQDLESIGRIARTVCPGVVFHADGVQAFCRMPLRLPTAGVDLYAISAHKIHGPKGVGALLMSPRVRLRPQLFGGGQQKEIRPGTQNVPGILGFQAAALEWKQKGMQFRQDLRAMKLRLWEGIREAVPDAVCNGPAPEEGAPHILSVGFSAIRGETLLHALEEDGFCVGTGSACSSHRKTVSSALLAQGVPREIAQSTVRLSLGMFNTMEEMDAAAEAIGRQAARLRRFQRR